MNEQHNNKAMTVLSLITAVGLLLFWIGFFTVGLAPENPPACYFAYEHSFPLPDTVLALVLLAGGALSLRGRPLGTTLLAAGGGALVFLGLLDFCFNYQNGMYSISTMDLILNAFINIWCVAFGAALVISCRR